MYLIKTLQISSERAKAEALMEYNLDMEILQSYGNWTEACIVISEFPHEEGLELFVRLLAGGNH